MHQVRSLGNGLDRTLYPFYKNDIANGTLTMGEIKEFIAYFLLQWSSIGNCWGEPFYLGVTNLDGSTKINDLSYDIIDVYDKLLIIDKDMNVISAEGDYKPSSEIKMHMRCYTEREDVGAVVHAHPPTATGFAVACKSLDEYSMIETVITTGSIPLAPYGTPSTNEVPEAIAPYLKEHDVLLLQNHGALTVGCDLITAYYRMETLELFAKISLTAHMLGGAKEIPKEQIALS